MPELGDPWNFFAFFFLFRPAPLFLSLISLAAVLSFVPLFGLAGFWLFWLHDKPRSQPLLTLFADQGPPDAEQSSDPPVV